VHQKCANYGGFQITGFCCVFEAEGDALNGNTYIDDGYDGNLANADFGQIVWHAGLPSNCFSVPGPAGRHRGRSAPRTAAVAAAYLRGRR
jgi:hypothetical protein